jgi:chemotaxis protein methyltransferase CheR
MTDNAQVRVFRGGQEGGREFAYTSEDFERIRRLIYARAGIALGSSKRDMAYSRLSRRVRSCGLSGFGAYLDALESGDEAEWGAFVNSLTTNQTSFFREPHHFPILTDLLKRLPRGQVSIWCAAASTGEEPYSIAMTVVEYFGGFDVPVKILATDVDTTVLETARAGVYALDRLEGLSPQRVKRFFLAGARAYEGMARVRPELARLVTFRALNLIAPQWPMKTRFDAIFCRNVMIYFDKPTQRGILVRFSPLLKADGLLFAGHSESFFHAKDLFEPLGKTVYRPVPAAAV